jgi:hypothetical protein
MRPQVSTGIRLPHTSVLPGLRTEDSEATHPPGRGIPFSPTSFLHLHPTVTSTMSSDRQEDAEKALNVARQRLEDGKYEVARRLATKSKSMFPTAAADALLAEISRREASGEAGSSSSQARATGAEAHPSAAGTHQRPGHHSSSNGAAAGASTGSTAKAREFTPEQRAVVKRVRACKVTEYYAILDRKSRGEGRGGHS